MTSLRILLVEDDAIIGALVSDMLSELGHFICGIARTETEAMDAAALHAPDLMIVDAYLQAGTGRSVMDLISRGNAMPHILMTGGSRRGMPPQATVLHNSFGTDGLLAALDRVASQIAALPEGSAHAQP